MVEQGEHTPSLLHLPSFPSPSPVLYHQGLRADPSEHTSKLHLRDLQTMASWLPQGSEEPTLATQKFEKYKASYELIT